MPENTEFAKRFEENRGRLRAVARRMLGSIAEAEDAVQEAWLRLSRSDANSIVNLEGWLTTVVARICLDQLRARAARPEESLEGSQTEASLSESATAEDELLLADAMGPALMIVIDTLPPAERVAFVLHDLFAVPFEEIAGILDRSPDAARQLASRARRRIQGRAENESLPHRARHQGIVDAFLAASRNADFEALLAVLSPDVVFRADTLAVQTAAARRQAGAEAPEFAAEIRGSAAVAGTFKGQAKGALRALVDGTPGAVWVQGGHVRSAFIFEIRDGRVTEIDLVMEPARLQALRVEIYPA